MNGIFEAASWLCLVSGGVFCVIGAVGMLRMPDLYTRMHAASKASVFGLGFLLAATCIHFAVLPVIGKAIAAVGFMFLTMPVAAHMIGRAGYLHKVAFWHGTKVDELAGRYRVEDGKLD